jgi:hypothetical protein
MVERIITELERRGLRAEIISGALRLTPSDRIDSDLREALREHIPAVLAHFAANGDADVERRLKPFLIQLQPLQPPAVLPFLVALDAESNGKEGCPSCAEPRGDGDGFLCVPCVTAKRLAIELWLQRPPPVTKVA